MSLLTALPEEDGRQIKIKLPQSVDHRLKRVEETARAKWMSFDVQKVIVVKLGEAITEAERELGLEQMPTDFKPDGRGRKKRSAAAVEIKPDIGPDGTNGTA